MARPVTSRSRGATFKPQAVPVGQSVDMKEYFTQPTGVDYFNSLDSLDNNRATAIKNLRLWNKKYQVRPPVTIEGGTSTRTLVGVVRTVFPTGTERLVRWHTTGVEYLIGGIWISLSTAGTPLALTKYDEISSTVWGNKLAFTDGQTGIYEIDWDALTYTKIAAAPICRHITTFGSRIIASYITDAGTLYATRIQWCVKNNNADWTGIGSGFEDLISSPGGVVDNQLAIVPVNDTEALVHRTGSVWLMQTTGYYDTPFSWQYLFGDLRCDSWKGITTIPNGSVILGREDVYLVNASGFTSIGESVRSQLLDFDNDPSKAQLTWDPQHREAIVYVPKRTMANVSTVWRCQVDTKQWTCDEYLFDIKTLTQASVKLTTAIDSLTGTINDLLGKIDDLGAGGPGGQYQRGLIFASYGANGFVGREDVLGTTDLTYAGTGSVLPFTLTTGYINSGSAYRMIELVKAAMLYTAVNSTTVLVDYSVNGGTTWTNWTTLTCLPSDLPISVRGMPAPVERRQMQLRISSTSALGFALQSLLVGTVLGSEIFP